MCFVSVSSVTVSCAHLRRWILMERGWMCPVSGTWRLLCYPSPSTAPKGPCRYQKPNTMHAMFQFHGRLNPSYQSILWLLAYLCGIHLIEDSSGIWRILTLICCYIISSIDLVLSPTFFFYVNCFPLKVLKYSVKYLLKVFFFQKVSLLWR